MLTSTILIIAGIAVTIILALLITVYPGLTKERGGKIFAFFPLMVFPIMAGSAGAYYHMETSKRTDFCLSCHTMSEHGRSLLVDDSDYLAAQHYQNQRVPREQACYTCHGDYSMFGDIKAKWRGLNHVYVYYLGKIPEPSQLKLYQPYNNRECLHCHAGARSFEEGVSHNLEPQTLPAIKSNEMSCLTSGCHETAHKVATLKDKKLWEPGKTND
jgi:cytochrome c-type protein NapC